MAAVNSLDRDALRDFYRSSGTNFAAFKGVQERRSPSKDSANNAVSPSDIKMRASGQHSLSGSPTLLPRLAADETTPDRAQRRSSEPVTSPATSANTTMAVTSPPPRLTPIQHRVAATADGTTTSAAAVAPTPSTSPNGILANSPGSGTRKPNTASPSAKLLPVGASEKYIEFLKQQQSTQKAHNAITELVANLAEGRRDRQSALTKQMSAVQALLHEVEDNQNWGLQSKYGVQQLVRDAQLSLQTAELSSNDSPSTGSLISLTESLRRLSDRYRPAENVDPAVSEQDPTAYEANKLFIEQAMRRTAFLEGTARQHNGFDVSRVASASDPLLVGLEEALKVRSIEAVICDYEAEAERNVFRSHELLRQRAASVEDGEVNVAEKLTYDLLELQENMLQSVISKGGALQQTIDEHRVLMGVIGEYGKLHVGAFDSMKRKAEAKKERCQQDLGKMFALREKVEEVEAQTAAKVTAEIEVSDKALAENTQRITTIFTEMEKLERELEGLTRQRHREIQRRFQEKDKDAHRRVEYAKFVDTVEAHAKPLERTLANMDVLVHSIDTMDELLRQGFDSLTVWGDERLKEAEAMKLESHKEHCEIVRELCCQIGDIAFRKERMIEETDKGIQRAHVEQEVLTETFDPNAKKFGDMKKRLLQTRTDLEEDVTELKHRAAKAIEDFGPCEAELHRNEVSFVHPLTEQQTRLLATKARMLEVKAHAVGAGGDRALQAELAELQQGLKEAQQELQVVNEETSGTVGKSIPMLRSMQKARLVVNQ